MKSCGILYFPIKLFIGLCCKLVFVLPLYQTVSFLRAHHSDQAPNVVPGIQLALGKYLLKDQSVYPRQVYSLVL